MHVTEIVRMVFGSHLYGTQTEQSDRDFMSVVVPSGREILMGRSRAPDLRRRQKAHGERNTPEDVDDGTYTLGKFVDLLSEGQTGVLDMLFAPPWALLSASDGWCEIQENRGRLLTRRAEAFLGYCKGQAAKYGIKGSRVAAARAALGLLDWVYENGGPHCRLWEAADRVEELVAATEHMGIVGIQGPADLSGNRRTVQHWEVCNRKMPYTQTVKEARELMARLVAEYGRRALQAETNQGVDWKALSHSVRVGHESLELLTEGVITFPRPEAAHLVRIKTGGLEYREVAAEIEDLLERVEGAAAASALPESIDRGWADGLVEREHLRAVAGAYDLVRDDGVSLWGWQNG